MTNSKPRVLILGGGFGGMYAALEFERALMRGADLDVTLVNHDNFFLFTPMLHEVAASDLDITTRCRTIIWCWRSGPPRTSSTSQAWPPAHSP